MARGLGYLRDQAIRLRRTKWANAPMLSEEMYLILQGIDPPVETIATTDEDGNPITVPFLDIPGLPDSQFDLDLPANPVNDPPTVEAIGGDPESPASEEEETAGTAPDQPGTLTTTKVWRRNSFPGKILSQSSGEAFLIRIYPNHFLAGEPFYDITATITDSTAASSATVGTWVTVFLAAQYEVQVTQLGSIKSTGSIKVVQTSYVFNAPPAAVSVFPGKVVSGDQAGNHTVEVYRNGTDGDSEQQTVKQLFIASGFDIPADAWVQVHVQTITNDEGEAEEFWWMQAPVWL